MALKARVEIAPTTRYRAFDFRADDGYVTGLEVDGLLTLAIGIYDDAAKYAAIGLLMDELDKVRQGIARRIAEAAMAPGELVEVYGK